MGGRHQAEIAKEEPQAALSAYNTGISQRWKFLQRTVPGIGVLLAPLEYSIRTVLIPALIGRQVSEIERRLLALPYRYGGIGILNPVNETPYEYESSTVLSSSLTLLISAQNTDVTAIQHQEVKLKKKELKTAKEERLKEEQTSISEVFG